MTTPATFREFEANARADGFDEAIERRWEPNAVIEAHRHSFTARALVTAGEMWLTRGAETQHLRAGETFFLNRDEPHAERYGADGATYWVARKNA